LHICRSAARIVRRNHCRNGCSFGQHWLFLHECCALGCVDETILLQRGIRPKISLPTVNKLQLNPVLKR
jgi:hypothetical protein